ncbi:unnamed protein product [Hymenolepis diminuta]|uniref:Reverse transcriptase domain-containing protein n=1 Tax=Hymenolepis diminuta TaxID=6216 RepID=A0A0R3SVH2_HYMDI|nr:unnamed protein product [Hymenolepis diminuta]
MNNMISGLEDMGGYLDDIIVVGESEELQGRVEKLVERIKKYSFHLEAHKHQREIPGRGVNESKVGKSTRSDAAEENHAEQEEEE